MLSVVVIVAVFVAAFALGMYVGIGRGRSTVGTYERPDDARQSSEGWVFKRVEVVDPDDGVVGLALALDEYYRARAMYAGNMTDVRVD